MSFRWISRRTGQNLVGMGQPCTIGMERPLPVYPGWGDYLLRYRPTMYQGNFSYHYELFFLKDGVETTVQQKSISFDTNFSAPFHGTFDPIAISTFVDELNGLLAHSVQLFNIPRGPSSRLRSSWNAGRNTVVAGRF